jgi:hypothetical protein
VELRHFAQPAFDMLDVLVCTVLATISPSLIESDTPTNRCGEGSNLSLRLLIRIEPFHDISHVIADPLMIDRQAVEEARFDKARVQCVLGCRKLTN